MKKRHLLACTLSVVLAASATFTSYAEVQQYNDGQQHTVDHDVINTDPQETAVEAQGSGTSVTVNGDVESERGGAYSWEEGSAEVNGDVTSERTGAGSWDAGSSTTVNGNVTTEGDHNVWKL